ncbi:MAG: hypothetical protein BWY76_00967 [bacterium ADurb.Bin429]|nr:MAG: hypothetical protein BWY76_00967 [bacterium ADurb.Bin429]
MTRIVPLLLILLAALGARALPTLTGPTGLVVLPDALAADAGLRLAGDVAENPGDRGILLRGIVGLPAGEVGVLYGIDDEDMLGINGKFTFPVALLDAEGAMGALYLDADVVTQRCLYLAVTRPGPISVTGGLTWTDVRTVAGSADAVRPYVGAVLILPSGMRVMGEAQAKSSRLEPKAITSLRIAREEGLVTTVVGVTNAVALLGTTEHYLFAGMSLAFGG